MLKTRTRRAENEDSPCSKRGLAVPKTETRRDENGDSPYRERRLALDGGSSPTAFERAPATPPTNPGSAAGPPPHQDHRGGPGQHHEHPDPGPDRPVLDVRRGHR